MSAGAVDKFKAEGRESRLTNTIQGRIDEEWRKAAYAACDDSVRAYWLCRQEAGFLVAVKCKPQNSAMNDCLNAFVRNHEAYDAFKAERGAELMAARRAVAAEMAVKAGIAGGSGATGGAVGGTSR